MDEEKQVRAMRRDKVEVYRGKDGRWYWRRRSAWNNQITATAGQGYVNKSHAIRMAKRINRRSILRVEEW